MPGGGVLKRAKISQQWTHHKPNPGLAIMTEKYGYVEGAGIGKTMGSPFPIQIWWCARGCGEGIPSDPVERLRMLPHDCLPRGAGLGFQPAPGYYSQNNSLQRRLNHQKAFAFDSLEEQEENEENFRICRRVVLELVDQLRMRYNPTVLRMIQQQQQQQPEAKVAVEEVKEHQDCGEEVLEIIKENCIGFGLDFKIDLKNFKSCTCKLSTCTCFNMGKIWWLQPGVDGNTRSPYAAESNNRVPHVVESSNVLPLKSLAKSILVKQSLLNPKIKIRAFGDSLLHTMDVPTVKLATGAHIQLHKCYGSSVFMPALFPLQNFNTLLHNVDFSFTDIAVVQFSSTDLTNCPLGVSEGYQQQRAILSNQNMFGSIFKVALEYPHLKIVVLLRPPRTDIFNELNQFANYHAKAYFSSSTFHRKEMIYIGEHKHLEHEGDVPGDSICSCCSSCSCNLLSTKEARFLKEDDDKFDGIHFRGREGKVAYTHSVLDILKKAGVW